MLLLQHPMLLKLDRFWLGQYSEQELRQPLGLTMGSGALRPAVWPLPLPAALEEEEATLSRTANTRPLPGQSQAAKATNQPAIGSCVCAKGC